MTKVVITGADGFVGQALAARLYMAGSQVHRVLRHGPARNRDIVIDDIATVSRWAEWLPAGSVVIHLAARAHVMRDPSANPLDAYRWVNVRGTKLLAEAAVEAQVRRFILMSTIKVNGAATRGTPFREQSPPSPEDAYGQSKYEAEQALWGVQASGRLETVVVRAPLVYGPGVKGNLLRLLRWIARGYILPFGSVENKRSMIGLDNLVDLLVHCIDQPEAANQLFLASDQRDLSTPELVEGLAAGFHCQARLAPFPVSALRVLGWVAGQGELIERLVGSLEIDGSKAAQLLGWRPPVTVEAGLYATAAAYHRKT